MIDLSQGNRSAGAALADAQSVSIDAAVQQALEVSAHAAGIAVLASRRMRDPSPEAAVARGARIDQIDKALLATASALDVVLIVVGIPGQLADDRVEARAPDSRVGGEVLAGLSYGEPMGHGVPEDG